MRLLKKGLTESIYNSILNEGSFGDEVGFGDFSSIDEMEEEFTNKLYSFFGKEPSDLDFSKFELHRGTSWTDDNPWMLVEATGLDDIFEDIIIEKGKAEYPNLYNLYQEDGLVIYETGLEIGRNHGDRNYFDVVVYNTTDIHYLTYDEMSSDQAKALEKKVDEETNRICAYMEGIIKEHYQELLDIMLNNEYIDEDDEMYESKKVRKSKKLDEAKKEEKQKVFYFLVGICLDENRPDAHEEDFYDMPDFGIPYKLMDENYGVTKTAEEAVGYVEKYVSSGVPGTFGAVVCSDEPFEGFKDDIDGGFNEGLEFTDISEFKRNGGELIYCAYSTGEDIKTVEDTVYQYVDVGYEIPVNVVSSINRLYDFVSDKENRKLFNSDGIDEEVVDLVKKLTRWTKYNSKEELIKDVNYIISFINDTKEYFYDGINEEIIDSLNDIKKKASGSTDIVDTGVEEMNESSDEAKRAPIRKYTAYVFNWVNDHGYTEEFKKVWDKYSAPEYDGMSTEEIMGLVFNELADENGFNGELFVSPAEFYDNEGLEESVELTKFEWKDGLDGFEYYTDPDKDIYAKNIKSGRLYFCTSDGDPDVEIEDDSKYIIKENVDETESIGSIEEIDGKMYYVSDSTNNGFCYKDAKAYNNEPDKICYLCEAAFDESEDEKLAVDYVEANKERLVDWGSADTKNSIRAQVRTMLEEEEYWYESNSGEKIEAKDFDDELIDIIADDAFYMVDWQTVNGYLLEREWDETVEDYYDKKFGTLKESEYVEVDSKSVQDSDGFTTDYTMYKDENGKYVFVFGDKDLYKPEDGDFDWEAETEEEAREWFDSYKGLNEAAKPKKKKDKKKKEDERRVIMQQGNVTCFKENDNKFLVFENENDNEKEYPDQDSAMKDFMARVGVDTDRELKESVTLAGKKFPVRKRPLKESTRYGDTNPDEISPDAYLRIEDREDGSKYVDAGIGDHTSLGGGQYSKYPDGEVSRLYKEVRSKAKEKKVKVHDKLKNDVGYYDEIIPKYNADIEQDLKDLEPYRDRPLKRRELDDILDITGRRDASGSSERQMKYRMSGDYGRLMTKVNDLKRNLNDLDQDGVKEIWIN